MVLTVLLVGYCTPIKKPIEFVDCGTWNHWQPIDDVKCGYLTVPENHYQPKGKKIRIAFSVFKAKNPDRDKLPVVMLTGGPGARSLQTPTRWLNHEIRNDHDLIVVEQRGIGRSSELPGLNEAFIDILSRNLTSAEEIIETKKLIAEKSDELHDQGFDLQYYNSIQNAKDIGTLMQSLGYPAYLLHGESYGTKLAMMVMKYFPEWVAGVVLDAPNTLSGKALEQRFPDFLRSLNLCLENCKQDVECNSRYPNLQSKLLEALVSLAEAPVTVNLLDRPFTINPQDAIFFMRYLLYRSDAFRTLPEYIHAILSRNLQKVQQLSQWPAEMLIIANTSMFMCVNTYEELDVGTSDNVNALLASEPVFAYGLAWFQSLVPGLSAWHDGRISTEERYLPTLATPTLIIVNEFDPITPPENTKAFEAVLSSVYVLQIHDYGHGSEIPCVLEAKSKFLRDPNQFEAVYCE
jgi:pimeloyl-ACP methyl ester carboxylesterase